MPITVIPAPEPSDIIWENVETPARSRLWRQFVTAGILVLLLCGSVIILSVAQASECVCWLASLCHTHAACLLILQHYKAKFEALAPSLGLCNTAIPTGAYEGPPPADAALYHNSSLDCSDGSYYINYMSDGVELDPSLTWGCKPHPQRSSPRCVSVHDTSFSTDKCDPTELTANGTVSLNQTYERYSILGCFCLHSLDSLIATYGVFTGVRKLIDEEGDVCFSFAIQYVTGQSLLIAAALAVVVINAILKVTAIRFSLMTSCSCLMHAGCSHRCH